MKKVFKYAAAVMLAAAFAVSMATPSQAAQQKNTMAAQAYNGYAPSRSRAHDYAYASQAYAYRDVHPGYGAYAYAPSDNAIPSCAMQGNYGSPIDYAACY